MVVRSKTRSRLAILLVVVFALVAIAGGAYVYKKGERQRRALKAREQGMALYEQGKQFDALHKLGTYLNYEKNDLEVMIIYAELREKVEEPNGIGHLQQAAHMLRQILVLKPEDEQIRRRLLDLYTRTDQDTEALKLAEQFLAQNPNDPEALWAKAVAIASNQHQRKEALDILKRYTELKPLDIQGHHLTIQTMQDLNMTREQMTAYVDTLLERDPNETRYNTIAAINGLLLTDADMALNYVDLAAKDTPPDLDTVRLIANAYDVLGKFPQTTEYLGRALEQFDDNDLRRFYLFRLWESNQQERFLEVAEQHDYTAFYGNSDLLALKAVTLYRLKREAEAEAVVERLANRNDNSAKAWTLLFQAGVIQEKPPATRRVEICEQALVMIKDRPSPYILTILADANRELGETELAIQQWRKAAEIAKGWADPLLAAADLLSAIGQPKVAIEYLELANLRQPNSYKIGILLASAWANDIENLTPNQLNHMEAVTTELVNLNPTSHLIVPARAELLAHQDRTDELRQLIATVLESDQPVSPKLLLVLARYSRDKNLGLDQALVDAASDNSPDVPGVAYAQALLLADADKVDEGRASIDAARKQSDTPDAPEWQILLVRYDQRFELAEPIPAWTRLAEAYPDSLIVQRSVLSEPATWADRQLIDQSINRLVKITGERSMNWRVYRAKWLMQTGDLADTAEAVKLLNEVVEVSPLRFEPHTLLAACFYRQGNASGAVEELQTALQIMPNDVPALLELARLRIIQNDNRTAMEQIELALEHAKDNTAFLRTAAMLMVQAGDPRRAIGIIEQTRNPDRANVDVDLLLANIYRGMRDYDKANEIYTSIATEDLTPAAVEFIANYYGSLGQTDKALQALDKLDTIDVEPGVAALVRGAYYVRQGLSEQAIEHLEAVLADNNQQPLVWLMLITQHLQLAQSPTAVDTIRRAAAACPEDQAIQLVFSEIELIRSLGDNPLCLPLFSTLLNDPERSEPALLILRVLEEANRTVMTHREVEVRVRRISDRFPNYMPARMLVIRFLRFQGRVLEAAAEAEKTTRTFPESIESAALAAELYADAGRWEQARAMAREWRNRSEHQPIGADLLIAEASIEIGQTEVAVEQTATHIDMALQNPDLNETIIFAHCQALLADGQTDRLKQLLTPRLAESSAIRSIWLRLTSDAADNPAQAQDWIDQARAASAGNTEDLILVANTYYLSDANFKVKTFTPKAIEILSELTQADTPDVDAIMLLGIIYDSRRENDKAIAQYRRVISLEPNRPIALNNLAMKLSVDDTKLTEAHDLAERAVKLAPRSAAFHDTLGTILQRQGKHTEAIISIRRALQLQPRNVELAIRLALAHVKAGQTEEASRMYEQIDKAIGLNPNLPANVMEQFKALKTQIAAES